jgi:hypothetical protein
MSTLGHLDLNSPSSAVRSPKSGLIMVPQSQNGSNLKRRRNFPTPIGGGEDLFDPNFTIDARD